MLTDLFTRSSLSFPSALLENDSLPLPKFLLNCGEEQTTKTIGFEVEEMDDTQGFYAGFFCASIILAAVFWGQVRLFLIVAIASKSVYNVAQLRLRTHTHTHTHTHTEAHTRSQTRTLTCSHAHMPHPSTPTPPFSSMETRTHRLIAPATQAQAHADTHTHTHDHTHIHVHTHTLSTSSTSTHTAHTHTCAHTHTHTHTHTHLSLTAESLNQTPVYLTPLYRMRWTGFATRWVT